MVLETHFQKELDRLKEHLLRMAFLVESLLADLSIGFPGETIFGGSMVSMP